MFRISVIASLAIGLSLVIAAAGSGQPDTPKEAPDQKWKGADVLLIGKMKAERVATLTDPPTVSDLIHINPKEVLGGSAKLDKMFLAYYPINEGDVGPRYPGPDKECLIALASERGGWRLIHVEVTTRSNIQQATKFLSSEPVTKPIKLFNGKDLTNFYTWLGKPYQNPADKNAKPLGKNNDPHKVFTVADGAIRISGEVFGGLITEKEYENYHLVAEFKWGTKTWPPREKAARDSGILLHCVGADGEAGGNWMEAIECQMIEGGTGDFILVGGMNQPRLTATAKQVGKEWYFDPKGETRRFTSGRVNWFGRDPAWKDIKGFRGKNDVEKAVGQWNKLECICDHDKITVILNGATVNSCSKVIHHTRGKILFQSEGAEVFFRRIELLPLKK